MGLQEHMIAKVDASSLHISENTSVLEKASRFATKTRKKVTNYLNIDTTLLLNHCLVCAV